MVDSDNSAALDIFVPDFCQPRAVAVMVIGAELLAFTLVLANASSWAEGLDQLASTSLYVQWAALLSGGLLCLSRRGLVRLTNRQAAAAAFAIPLLANLLVTLAADLLARQGLMSILGSGQPPLAAALLRNLLITAMVGGVVRRYLYIRHEAEKSLAAQHQANLGALQARIRPHFLFNSLNTIISLVREQPDVAEEALQDMAELFRHNLRQSEQLTRLGDDISLCRQYLALEKLRLGERLNILWQLDDLDPTINIPPLVLQPLLENAVYHGIEPLTASGTITIEGRSTEAGYQIMVSNPLPPAGRGGQSGGHRIAVDNVRQRLAAHFGDRAALQIDVSTDQYCVTLTLPA